MSRTLADLPSGSEDWKDAPLTPEHPFNRSMSPKRRRRTSENPGCVMYNGVTVNKSLILFLLSAGVALSQGRVERYAVILEEPPVAAQVRTAAELRSAAGSARRSAVALRQQPVRDALEQRGIGVTHATQLILNAIYIRATAGQAAEAAKLPGVKYVAPDLPIKRHLNQALDLMNVPSAWTNSQIGGQQNAGRGVKVAIVDTGIDNNHAAFKDPAMQAPSGYPLGDSNFTNGKVIVARSYVQYLVQPLNSEPKFWRGDDTSARDRVGHGTAVGMIVAGTTVTGPANSGTTITGVAPKAWLGNYKVFGSPGVNDFTYGGAITAALEDAITDGMDIAVVAAGSPALWAPTDSGQTCGNDTGVLCDWKVEAVENAVAKGLTIIVSAGDDGLVGTASALASINSPGTAPSAITVGATTNSHIWFQTLSTTSTEYDALFGDGPLPGGAISGILRDVSKLGDDGYLCSPFTGSGLNGRIALIQRGNCALDSKVYNAENAGATAVVIYQGAAGGITQMTGLGATGIPAILVSNAAGGELKTYAAGTTPTVKLDPAWLPFDTTADDMIGFSSQGPSIDNSIKPEVVGTGTDLYTATQVYDPNGDMYNATGYTVANGTSFSAGIAAGIAALVKQARPGSKPADIKSSLVNTANSAVYDFDSSGNTVAASVKAMGAGKLDAAKAVATNLTVSPAAISFGVLANMQNGQRLSFCNWSNSGLTLTFAVQPTGSDPGQVTLNPSSVIVAPNRCVSDATLVSFGSRVVPAAGSYEGVILVNGGATQLRIPYLYMVSARNPVPYNYVPLLGYNFIGTPGGGLTLTLKVTDQYGIAIPGVQVAFAPAGQIVQATAYTDSLGITEAQATAPNQLGETNFTASLLNTSTPVYTFYGRVRLRPAVNANGVVNAASNQVGQGIAPGSMVSIYGTGFGEAAQNAYTVPLPLSLLGVSVSFDTATTSYPASILYVGEQQVNVQVPWELAGQTSATMKVNFGETFSDLYTAPVNPYSPAIFEHADSSGGGTIVAAQNDAYQDISSANPAQKGRVIILYTNGLGPVQNQPATGSASPGSPNLAYALNPPQATIGGVNATVQFAGLTPGFVALYQVNVVVPETVASGLQPVILTSNGIPSKPVNLPVR
jgi:minor extracellular serine protease Vpr